MLAGAVAMTLVQALGELLLPALACVLHHRGMDSLLYCDVVLSISFSLLLLAMLVLVLLQ